MSAAAEDFGSEGWLAAVRAAAEVLPAVPGCSVRASVDVAGGPAGPCRLAVVVADGRLAELSRGRLAEADCSVTVGAADAAAILSGDLDPAAAYMQGRLKIDGAYERALFGLRPMAATAAFATFAAEVRARTAGD
ncbi:MAG: SCP2 sterol-binding domain-containing protein [bacterium]|nr:SCP2 sterol-binding domain-containing protein [bacterium]MXZ29967.1 SCP2 sterol-binding domain-containing protein [Acidimicrobiia bacterium]MYB23872.1 SCP2 sterol-binding domain-containing protein [Acidimicrobiia bacterium]MYE67928.1 SCP2 sterol-binding domain-containing protein [Acidimicrobiia bacterium]MYJ14019.1 SCP2 sterol-binding domain-containing protein [Acidimicrobiia bacterium]